MTNRLNFFLLGLLLLLTSIFFMGCTSPESAENFSNRDSIHFPSQSDVSVVETTKTPIPPEIIISNNKMTNKWGPYALAQNATVYHQFDSNTSYELSLGDITIRQNETPGTEPSYIIKINVTVKNSGTEPIEVYFQTEYLKDYSGDGCQYRNMSWCGTLILGTINPGKLKTQTEDITFFSTKGYEYLSSEKFLLQGVIVADSNKVGGTNTKAWLIDLKKPQIRVRTNMSG